MLAFDVLIPRHVWFRSSQPLNLPWRVGVKTTVLQHANTHNGDWRHEAQQMLAVEGTQHVSKTSWVPWPDQSSMAKAVFQPVIAYFSVPPVLTFFHRSHPLGRTQMEHLPPGLAPTGQTLQNLALKEHSHACAW